MEIESQILNICLIGSTGSGKSSTGNTLFGKGPTEPFTVGHDMVSCTFFADQHINHEKKIRIIDTPGFGDNRVHEKQVDKIIKDLTIMLTDPRIESSGVIDAFVLPVRFHPRPSTLKTDLEHFIDLFGTVALKTLVLLPILEDQKKRISSQEFVNHFKQFHEIVNIIREGKQEGVNENWFCLWDNIDSKRYPNQERDLLKKINLLERYTHQKFVEAAEEIKRRIDSRVQEEVNRQVDRIKKEHAHDEKLMKQKMKELEEKAEKEKAEIKAAVERGRTETIQLAEMFERIGTQNQELMKQMYEQVAQEREKNRQEIERLMQDQSKNHEEQIKFILETQGRNIDKMISEMALQRKFTPLERLPSCSIF